MTDIFDTNNLSVRGHDTDNSSMPLVMGGDRTHSMPLFLQNKAGIPHVTNWDDSVNSASKTDKSYFVDQQAGNSGDAKDIAILDDICVVGFPNHKASIKTVIDVSADASEIYAGYYEGIDCYNNVSAEIYRHVFGTIIDYTLETPEIDDSIVSSSEPIDSKKHTYFADTYLKVIYNGVTNYYPFGGFVTQRRTEYPYFFDSCQDVNPEELDRNSWYYIVDTQQIGFTDFIFNSPETPTLCGGFSSNISFPMQRPATPTDDITCSVCDDGETYICTVCNEAARRYCITKNVEAYLIKRSDFECGKIDIYHKKSGKIESYTDNRVTSTDHDLSDYDIIRISGEFGTGNLVSDLNGVLYADRIDENTFGVYSDPSLNEEYAVRVTDIEDFTGMVWTCVGNAEKEQFQSWFHYGSYGSLSGVNGYNIIFPSDDYGGNFESDLTVEEWDALIPDRNIFPYSTLWPLGFKSANDYPAKQRFGYSVDIEKIDDTAGDSFYMITVGAPAQPVTFNDLGQNNNRQDIVPSADIGGGVHTFRVTTDSNNQINAVDRSEDLKELKYGSPWSNVLDLVTSDGSLLTNPTDIVSAIDIADNAVSDTYWLNNKNGSHPGNGGRTYMWSDGFGRSVGISNQRTDGDFGTDYTYGRTALTVGGNLYHQIYHMYLDEGTTNFLAGLTLVQDFYDSEVSSSAKEGIVQYRDRLTFGRNDGIYTFEYSNPSNLTDDIFTRIDIIKQPDDIVSNDFGTYIASYDDYILTNAVSTRNEFGNVSEYQTDYIHVYKRQVNDKYKLLQKIATCIHRNDEFYADLTDDDLADLGLVESDNLSYGGISEDTYTWTDSLIGKYDIFENKIIIRDRLQYIVLKDNWNTETKKPLSGSVSPENYFFYRERYNSEGQTTDIPCLIPPCPTITQYITYSYDSNFDGSVSVVESYYRHDTLVLFFDIPRFQGYVNVYNSLNVRLSIERNDAQDDAPMLMFYPADPRDTISSVYNMPATDGASNYGTSYDLGTYNGGNFVLEDDGTYTVDVDIPPSVFLAGLIEGDITDAQDQAQDSYNNTGSVNKTLAMGIKIRRRDDSRVDPYTIDLDRLNAGNFHESNSQIQDIGLRMSYTLHEEKSLRRFDLASRKLAIANIDESQPTSDLVSSISESVSSQIRMGNSLSSSYIDESEAVSKKGMLSESLQIFESVPRTFTNTYLDSDGDMEYTNSIASRTYRKTTSASIDIQEPEFLSLFVKSVPSDSGSIPLSVVGHVPSTGNINSFVKGIAFDTDQIPLFIGPLTKSEGLPLSLPNNYGSGTGSMPLIGPKLKGFEVPPTGAPLFIKGPDASGGVPLFQQAPIPSTGNAPLVTVGPLQDTGNIPLYQQGYKTFNTQVGRPPLYMAGMIPDTGGITLHMGRDASSGDMPLTVKGPIEDTNNMPLYMLSPYNDDLNLSMPLTKGLETKGMSLVMIDKREVKDVPLSINGPTQDTNNIGLFTKYTPINTNNLDDNPYVPCEVTGPNYEFDKTSNGEEIVVDHNSIPNETSTKLAGFGDIEGTHIGKKVLDSLSDSATPDAFYNEDRVNIAVDGNSSIFVVGDNCKSKNSDPGTGNLTIYGVSNKSLTSKTVVNALSLIDSDIYTPTARATFKDLDVSDNNRIAFSVSVRYSSVATGQTRRRDYIGILDSNYNLEKVISGQLSTNKIHTDTNKRLGDCIQWVDEDLYYSQQTSIFGKISKVKSSDNYATPVTIAEFEDTSDFAGYDNNLVYLSDNVKVGFGNRFVIDNNTLFVSAPLFDPYIAQNTLSSYTQYSPRGAVYLFTISGDVATYVDAVYANAVSSAALTPTTFDVTGVTSDVLYFGYDIDYDAEKEMLAVGQPSYSDLGKVYIFRSNNITLEKTIESQGSQIGMFVDVCPGITTIASENSIIRNSATEENYIFDSSLTDDEVSQYVPALQTLTASSETIKGAKLVNIGAERLIVNRKFDFSYGFTDDTIYKLTALTLDQPNGLPLFLKAPETDNANLPLRVNALQPGYLGLTLPKISQNNSLPFTLRAPEPATGDMRLHMTDTADKNTTLFIKGLFESGVAGQELFLKTAEPLSNSVPLSYVHPYDPQYRLNLSIRAADPSQQWDSASLFIDEGTVTRTATSFYDSLGMNTYGSDGVSSIQDGKSMFIEGGNTGYINARPTLFLKGQETVDVDNYMSLFVKVDPGSGSDNGSRNLFIKNTQTTGTIAKDNGSAPLYIINSIPSNDSTTLFLKRKGLSGGEELPSDMNLSISGPDAEGNTPLFVNSAFSGDGNMNMVVPNTIGAPTGYRSLMIRGYEE